MSDLVFPKLRCAALKIKRIPLLNTKIQTAPTGRETRISWQPTTPRFRYEIPLDALRQDSDPLKDEVKKVLETFWQAHGGRLQSFLFDDPLDGVRRRVRFDDDSPDLTRVYDKVWSMKLVLITVVGE